MKTINDLKVGDQVWWLDVNQKGLHSGEVSKIGRALITVGSGYSAYVFRKDTMRTNDGYGHQFLIVDLEHHQERQEVASILSAIYQARGGSREISLADAKEAARLLGVELG